MIEAGLELIISDSEKAKQILEWLLEQDIDFNKYKDNDAIYINIMFEDMTELFALSGLLHKLEPSGIPE